MQKFKLLATQCAVSGSPTHSPSTSPVIHLPRRKTLRMLLNRSSDHHRFSFQEDSSELQLVSEETPGNESDNRKEKIRVRRKLKELFVSSPPFEDEEKNSENNRDGLLRGSEGDFVDTSSSDRGIGLSGSLRPVSGTFRYRFLRRAWRPMLVTIPEQ